MWSAGLAERVGFIKEVVNMDEPRKESAVYTMANVTLQTALPSVGRIVHYHPTDEQWHLWAGAQKGKGRPPIMPAIITSVNDAMKGHVNLRVLGDIECIPRVPLVYPGDEPGQWIWPPRV